MANPDKEKVVEFIKKFVKHTPAFYVSDVSDELGLSYHKVEAVIRELVTEGMLIESYGLYFLKREEY